MAHDDETRPTSIKLLILGDSSVGKTSILVQFTNQYFDKNYLMTIGELETLKAVPCHLREVAGNIMVPSPFYNALYGINYSLPNVK